MFVCAFYPAAKLICVNEHTARGETNFHIYLPIHTYISFNTEESTIQVGLNQKSLVYLFYKCSEPNHNIFETFSTGCKCYENYAFSIMNMSTQVVYMRL